jgi:hypothetical protein
MNGELSLFDLDEATVEHKFAQDDFSLSTSLSSIEGSDNASIENGGVELITLAFSTLKTIETDDN